MFFCHCTGPFFFLSCFSVAVGAALLYYYGGKCKTCQYLHTHIKTTFPRLKVSKCFYLQSPSRCQAPAALWVWLRWVLVEK